MGALDGVRVVDFTQVIAGAYCTQILADLGADVIKVEKPTGDDTRGTAVGQSGNPDMSYGFSVINRNKRGIVVDIRETEGQRVIRKLLESADVLVENFRPGTLSKYGFGYEQLQADFPHLVYCSISGFGATGPFAAQGGYDLVAQGYSGLMSITGEANRGPMKAGVPVCDIAAGTFAANATLAAYIHTLKTGNGQFVETSLLEAGTAFTVWEAALLYGSGVKAGQTGTMHRMSTPYQSYPTGDGWINIGAFNQRSFENLAKVLGLEALIEDPRFLDRQVRMSHRDELNLILEEAFSAYSTGDLVKRLSDAGVPCGPVLDIEEAYSSEQARAREIIVEGTHPVLGEVKYLNTPFKMSITQPAIQRPAPLLGQHTGEVLKEAGYEDEQIQRFISSGIVAQSEHEGAGV